MCPGKSSFYMDILASLLLDHVLLDIKFLHVATYGPGDIEPQYYPSPSRSTHKVSLDPYRAASKRIFKIFRKYCKTIQRIGLDEGFLDLTDAINKKIIDEYVPHLSDKVDDQVCDVDIDWDELGMVIGKEDDTITWKDLQLAVGGRIAKQIRQEVYDELNYTCSAGNVYFCLSTYRILILY